MLQRLSEARDWIWRIARAVGIAKRRRAYAQGDVLLIPTEDIDPPHHAAVTIGQAVVLAEGEHTGHQHAFYGRAVTFWSGALAHGIPRELYVGHVRIASPGAVLEHGPAPGQHGDHDPLRVPPGTYIALRQRQYTGPAADARRTARLLRD